MKYEDGLYSVVIICAQSPGIAGTNFCYKVCWIR